MSVAISYPFTLDDAGRIVSTDQYSKIYLDRVLTLLSTTPKQRPMLQSYGADAGSVAFESGNNLQESISNIVRTAVNTWLPDIFVHEISVGLPDENGIADVTITVRLPNGNVSSVSLTTATFNYDGEIVR